MGFLAPAFLALGVFVGVPLLVHLLRRRVTRVVDFPAVQYLARMQQAHQRDLRVRHRLLLLLRLLAVLALALAAARPLARWAGVGHAPVAVALLVDNSMSSGRVFEGTRVLDRLRTEARRVLDALDAGDRVWLVTADGRVTGGAPAAVRSALDQLQPLGGRGALAAAATRAVTLAASGAPRAPVVALLTDGQRTAWADTVVEAGAVAVVAWAPTVPPAVNRAVLAATPEPPRWAPAGTVAFTVEAPAGTPWRLLLDGRMRAQGTVPPAGGAALRSPRIVSGAPGWVRGRVELDADALRADDVRWFAVRSAPPPAVAVRPEAGLFLATAVSALVAEGRLEAARDGGAGVVTVAGAEAAGVRLPALLVAPRDPLRVGEANRALARLGIPWRFGAVAREAVLARTPRAAADEAERPLVRALDGVGVRWRYPLLASPAAGAPGLVDTDTVAMAGAAPWVVAGPGYVLVGSPLDVEATDLPLRADFVPAVRQLVARRLGADGGVVEAVPGGPVAVPEGITAVEGTDGVVRPVTGRRWTAPPQAGVAFFRRAEARVGAVVVNPEREESRLEAGTGAALGAAWRGARVETPATGEAWARRVLAQGAGYPLVLPLLLVALVALLADGWAGRR